MPWPSPQSEKLMLRLVNKTEIMTPILLIWLAIVSLDIILALEVEKNCCLTGQVEANCLLIVTERGLYKALHYLKT